MGVRSNIGWRRANGLIEWGRRAALCLRRRLFVLVVVAMAAAMFFAVRYDPRESGDEMIPVVEALRAIFAGDDAKLRREAARIDLKVHGAALLCNAACNGNAKAVRTLLELGVDPNVKYPLGLTPLMSAAQAGRTDAVKCLLTAGADAGRQLWSGEDALKLAERAGHEDTAAVLRQYVETVERPVDPEAPDEE